MFYNRESELNYLNNEYLKTDARFIVLYGRRRVGKTALIKEFIENKPALYFLADRQLEVELIRRFQETLANFLKDDSILAFEFKSWDGMFDYLIKHADFSKKVVIVLDEFQYLARVNPAFPSILQRIWDEYLKNSNVFLVLCGSLIGMMYQTALSYESPLYGRRTGQIRLKPLNISDISSFFPNRSFNELVELYAVVGGVPKYIESFNPNLDIFSNIKQNVLAPEAFLYNEPRFVLSEEITEPITYFSILRTIAKEEHKIGKIAAMLGLKANLLNKYLETLIELDILNRRIPVTEKAPQKSKKGLYFIADNFFRFWFKYVQPNQGYLEIGFTDNVLRKIKIDFSAFVSPVFEDICRALLFQMSIENLLPVFEKVGSWWSKAEEIDIVAINEQTKEIMFGECKWTSEKIGTEVLDNLYRKATHVDWQKNERKEYFILFSKNGFTDELKEIAAKLGVFLVANGRIESM
ncbi:MAG: ATP-binding protein [Actinomycetota bacterium]